MFTRINQKKRKTDQIVEVKMVQMLKKNRPCFSFGNCVLNHLCCLQLESNKDVSCFASSNPILACQPGKEALAHCNAGLLRARARCLNAHQILTFRGLPPNSQCHKIFVGHLGKCYDATREEEAPIHSDFEHLIPRQFVATLE